MAKGIISVDVGTRLAKQKSKGGPRNMIDAESQPRGAAPRSYEGYPSKVDPKKASSSGTEPVMGKLG